MTGAGLEFDSVSKSFGRQPALSSVSFTVGHGEIVGFVGPNGAGKSTAMRVVVGLLRADAGEVRLDGVDQRRDPRRFRARVGALIESPAYYPQLTARDHLEYLARLRGHRHIAEAVDTLRAVGLDPSSRKPVRQFSLGMKQRLGIAMAIFARPALLVLDEPMNGLDPLAMAELRVRLRRVPGDTGAGILVSSHLLSEIEQVCDRVLFIRDGRLLEDPKLPVARPGSPSDILVRTSDDRRAAEVMIAAGVVASAEPTPGGLRCHVRDGGLGRVAPALVAAGLELYELSPRGPTLEDVYVATYGTGDGNQGLR